MSSINLELEHLSNVADAQLGVAEELAWPLAILSGVAAHLRWDSWFISIPVVIGAYVLTVYRYRRRAAAAEDRYFRAAGLGKYAAQRSSDI